MSKRDEMWIAWRNMTSRTKEPPFVELLICWEFYFGQFKVGFRFSTSQRNVSFYFVSAWNSRYKQNYFLLFPEFNLVSKGGRSNSIITIQAVSLDALANFKQCTTGNVSKVSAITMLVVDVLRKILRRGQHWLKSKCRYGEINSVRTLQLVVSNKHEMRIFLSFDCQSVTHNLTDTWIPNTKWQKKPSFEDWTFKKWRPKFVEIPWISLFLPYHKHIASPS